MGKRGGVRWWEIMVGGFGGRALNKDAENEALKMIG